MLETSRTKSYLGSSLVGRPPSLFIGGGMKEEGEETKGRGRIHSGTHIGSYGFYEDLYRMNHYDNIHNSLCPSICYLLEIRSSISSYLVQSHYWQVSLLVP